MAFPSTCAAVNENSLISVSENGRKFHLINKNNNSVLALKIDGCAIVTGERCDAMYFLPSGREIYVELKGADIKKAISQIHTTVSKISKVDSRFDRVGVIVSSRVPREDSATQNARFKLLRVVGSVKIKNTELRATEEELFRL